MNPLTFSDLALNSHIQKTLQKIKFITPADIQAQAIPVALEGKDIIGISQTGTGKTAAYSLPSLNAIKANKKTQVLILSSTRELVSQIDREVFRFSHGLDIHTLAIYGGSSFGRQKALLAKGIEVLVATPGRLLDLTKQGVIDYSHLQTVVIDEADEMLQMGFIDDIRSILSHKPESCQVLLFSATMPREIAALAETFMKNPVTIDCSQNDISTASVTHYHIQTDEYHKIKAITHLFAVKQPRLVIIFSNTKQGASDIAQELRKHSIKAEAIHGDLRQRDREKVMHRFRKGFVQCLVATDVAARGIDVRHVDLVINYDLPYDKEFYVHRTGRTGRAGKDGDAFSFVSNDGDFELFDRISRFAGISSVEFLHEHIPRIVRMHMPERRNGQRRNHKRNSHYGLRRNVRTTHRPRHMQDNHRSHKHSRGSRDPFVVVA